VSDPARKMSLLQATMLVAGNMIGTGLFLFPVHLASLGSIAISGWVFAAAGAAALELDWYLDWKLNEHFTCSVVAAAADPGEAVAQAYNRTDNLAYGMVWFAYSY
jgi:hypothetical protein